MAFANSPRALTIASAILAFAAAAMTTAFLGVPIPRILDEPAYLLQADTFAHGRLTNPPHPMWHHFETLYVLQQPTYQAKYPPAQAAFLAMGELAGLPIAGAWIAAALSCAAMMWMLLAWLPVRWAVAGALIAALHPTLLAWNHSYWGGSVAMLGGALLLGAARRLADRTTVADSLLLGTGVVVLANSRPFEGAIFVAASLVAGFTLRVLNRRAILPAAAIVAAGLLFGGYYNYRVTGHPTRMPYLEYERQYAMTPALLVQPVRQIGAVPDDFRAVTREWGLEYYREQQTVWGFVSALPRKMSMFANAAFQVLPDTFLIRLSNPRVSFLMHLLSIAIQLAVIAPLVLVAKACREDRFIRAATWVLLVSFVLALLPTVVPLPHYAAPLAPLLLLLWLAAVRTLRWRRMFLLTAAIAGTLGVILWIAEARTWESVWPEVGERNGVALMIEREPGQHLVLVRYTPRHQPHFSWIQNLAEIDSQRIVWARDLGDNAAILRYYGSRSAWLVVAGDRPPRITRLSRR